MEWTHQNKLACNRHRTGHGEDLGEKSVAVEEDKGSGTHKSCESNDMEESKSDLVKKHSAQHQSSEQQSTDEPTTKSEKTTSQSSEPVSPQKHNRFAFKHKHLHKNIGDENDDDIPTDICSRRLSILTESTEKIREEFNNRRLHLLNSLSDAIYRGRLLTSILILCLSIFPAAIFYSHKIPLLYFQLSSTLGTK